MWGNIQLASELEPSHPLSKLLFQLCNPGSIPYEDFSFWSSLFQHYDTLVHLDPDNNTVARTSCKAMGRNARKSRNLAMLALHTSRMLRELTAHASYTVDTFLEDETIAMRRKREASLLGKTRVTCASLNLLRILCHATITTCCLEAKQQKESNDKTSCSGMLEVIFRCTTTTAALSGYTSTSSSSSNYAGVSTMICRDAATELISSIFTLFSAKDIIAPMYDTVVFSLSLLLVLLSTQLYQPMVSSWEQVLLSQVITSGDIASGGMGSNFFLDKLMTEAFGTDWAHSLLSSVIHWIMTQPKPPRTSIVHHHMHLVSTLIQSRGCKPNTVDGLYDDYPAIVLASKRGQQQQQQQRSLLRGNKSRDQPNQQLMSLSSGIGTVRKISTARTLVQAAWGIMVASSTLLLLPFRLVRLAVSTIGLFSNNGGANNEILDADELALLHSVTCNEVIWLSTSPLSDLGSCVLLLLIHNFRARAAATVDDNDVHTTSVDVSKISPNAFLIEFSSLIDNRWEGRNAAIRGVEIPIQVQVVGNDEPQEQIEVHEQQQCLLTNGEFDMTMTTAVKHQPVSINFEQLFESLGDVVHNELGALLLYTFLQCSSNFSASISARSDLDTLVMPLLRTLYNSSASEHSMKQQQKAGLAKLSSATTTKNKTSTTEEASSSRTIASGGEDAECCLPLHDSVRNSASSSSSLHGGNNLPLNMRSFRSQSQLYVILILLLLFSQDSSFGADAFRRVVIPTVHWYKERRLKDISLGSLIVLVMIRSIAFNLNRLQDSFLLSNCCAVLLNLAPHIQNLQSYAAMRLVTITISCMKRSSQQRTSNNADPSPDQQKARNDTTVMTTLSELYEETSNSLLQVIIQSLRSEVLVKNLDVLYALCYMQLEFDLATKNLFFLEDLGSVKSLIAQANSIIYQEEGGINAIQAMELLERNFRRLHFQQQPLASSDQITDEQYGFTYEEEADPEVFFVPYVWEVAVCVISASFLEWDRHNICVFPLNIAVATTVTDIHQSTLSSLDPQTVSKEIDGLV